MLNLINEFSEPPFTEALGATGETLFDVAMADVGFRVIARNVREFEGKRWEETGQNPDRIVERDGLRYGVEIKNTLGYIDRDELDIKIKMNEFFGTTPFFVARNLPKTYMYRLYRAGGFGLLLDNQHYPLLASDLAKRVRQRLQLPVLCLKLMPNTTMRRFEAWHEKRVPVE